jgi:hypothetical protein
VKSEKLPGEAEKNVRLRSGCRDMRMKMGFVPVGTEVV